MTSITITDLWTTIYVFVDDWYETEGQKERGTSEGEYEPEQNNCSTNVPTNQEAKF